MGEFTRPKMEVLPDSALVTEGKFTHQVTHPQPYYLRKPRKNSPPAGEFGVGEKLRVLAHEGGEFCRATDARGLMVYTAFATLAPL